MSSKVLIIGILPPPLGGISIHLKRFLKHLDDSSIQHIFLDYKKEKKIKILLSLFRFKKIHLHLSNKVLRAFICVFLFVLRKEVILTFHGKYDFTNKKDLLSLRYSSSSIVLNRFSFNNAKKIKSNVFLIPAFIPPLENGTVLKKEIVLKITKVLHDFKHVYCTNATSYQVIENKEVYGGTDLINVFNKINNCALISPTHRQNT